MCCHWQGDANPAASSSSVADCHASYLDRNALPNARVQGIEKELGLEGDDYNVAISVLFAGYIALQIPSNMLLTRVRPSIYLPVTMMLW